MHAQIMHSIVYIGFATLFLIRNLEVDVQMTTAIEIGFEMESGKAVKISNNHLFVAGTTSSGKSETLRALIDRSKDDKAKILIIDSKRPRDYDDFAADVPLYIEKHMEPFMIKDLIESTERLSIKKELPELIRLARVSKSWVELLKVAKGRYDNAKGWNKDILEILIALFGRLVDEMDKHTFSKNLELPNNVNVMDISHLTDQLQQIVVSSVIRVMMRKRKRVRLVIDEAHRFVPQGAAAACSRDVIRLVREGRANENFLWMADQTVTGVQKDLLKQMQIWILGRQSELNEAKRTLEQIPQRKSMKITKEDVQTLGLGEFIVVTARWAKITYIWPVWVEREIAIKVAKGEITAEQVSDKPELEEDDLAWKQKYEEEHRVHLDTKKELEFCRTDDLSRENARKTITHYKDSAQTWVSEQMELRQEIEELKKQAKTKGDPGEVKKLKTQISNLTKDYEVTKKGFTRTLGNKDKEIDRLREAAVELQDIAEEYDTVNGAIDALRRILGTPNQSAGMVDEDAIVKRVLAKVGTGGTVTITEDIALGKHFQLRAYNTTLEQMDALTMEQVKILGWLMHVDKGVTRLELIKGIYQKDNLLGQASKKLTDNLEALKAAGLVRAGGGRIHANAIALVTEQLELVDATEAEIQQILAKVKGFIAKKLSAA